MRPCIPSSVLRCDSAHSRPFAPNCDSLSLLQKAQPRFPIQISPHLFLTDLENKNTGHFLGSVFLYDCETNVGHNIRVKDPINVYTHTQDPSLVHQFFRDAPNIDASSTKAPLCSRGGRDHEITDGDLFSQTGGFLGGSEATGPTPDHDQVIVVVVRRGRHHGRQEARAGGLEGVVTASWKLGEKYFFFKAGVLEK